MSILDVSASSSSTCAKALVSTDSVVLTIVKRAVAIAIKDYDDEGAPVSLRNNNE